MLSGSIEPHKTMIQEHHVSGLGLFPRPGVSSLRGVVYNTVRPWVELEGVAVMLYMYILTGIGG